MNTQNNGQVDYDPNMDMEQDIQNPLVLQNKLIEPESDDLNTLNRNVILANYDEYDLQTVRIRSAYRVHLVSLIETKPVYNPGNRLANYIYSHVDYRNNFDSSSSVGLKALGRKLLRTNISEHNIKQNEIKSPQINPIFPSKSNRDNYNNY
jgi:hypothetical protein